MPLEVVVCDELIDFVVQGMSLRKYKSVIKRDMIEKLGMPISNASFERICSKARQRIALSAMRKPKRFYEDGISFYEQIIADDTVPIAMKLRAQENLEMLVGLHSKEGGHMTPEEQANLVQKALMEIDGTDGPRNT
jgi:hypothetical protein